ncbi:MAG TPA: hypothetical protein VHA09_02300, partial [Nitrososphaera sp.]|nr:hypothetical protein [Nitrososphaera sp.]
LQQWFKEAVLDKEENLEKLALEPRAFSSLFMVLRNGDDRYSEGIAVTTFWVYIQTEAIKRWAVTRTTARDYARIVIDRYQDELGPAVLQIRKENGLGPQHGFL